VKRRHVVLVTLVPLASLLLALDAKRRSIVCHGGHGCGELLVPWLLAVITLLVFWLICSCVALSGLKRPEGRVKRGFGIASVATLCVLVYVLMEIKI
jgi:hypothetical protein